MIWIVCKYMRQYRMLKFAKVEGTWKLNLRQSLRQLRTIDVSHGKHFVFTFLQMNKVPLICIENSILYLSNFSMKHNNIIIIIQLALFIKIPSTAWEYSLEFIQGEEQGHEGHDGLGHELGRGQGHEGLVCKEQGELGHRVWPLQNRKHQQCSQSRHRQHDNGQSGCDHQEEQHGTHPVKKDYVITQPVKFTSIYCMLKLIKNIYCYIYKMIKHSH